MKPSYLTNKVPALKTRWAYAAVDAAVIAVLTGAVAFALGVFGPALDGQRNVEWSESQDLLDAQKQAQTIYQRELAFAKACREEHGEALVRQTVDGDFVCVPRHSKQAKKLAVANL